MSLNKRPTMIGIPAPRLPAPVGAGVYVYIARPHRPVAAPIVPDRIVIIGEGGS